jgi:hypothetical protein
VTNKGIIAPTAGQHIVLVVADENVVEQGAEQVLDAVEGVAFRRTIMRLSRR